MWTTQTPAGAEGACVALGFSALATAWARNPFDMPALAYLDHAARSPPLRPPPQEQLTAAAAASQRTLRAESAVRAAQSRAAWRRAWWRGDVTVAALEAEPQPGCLARLSSGGRVGAGEGELTRR